MTMKKQSKIVSWIMIIIGAAYLANLGFGVIEIIPDNIPGFGNLDEGGAGALILEGVRRLRR